MDEKDKGLTAQATGLSPIGCADVGNLKFHDALVNALREMIAAIDANSIDSEMLPGEPEVGIHPYKWHDEWAHYVRAILASLHREAIAEKPSFEGVDPNPARHG